MARHDIKATITGQKELSADIFLLEVEADPIARSSYPGQFCMLEVRDDKTRDPLLRRPLSIFDKEESRISFLYRVVGRGTKILSMQTVGNGIKILGPLGHGFTLRKASSHFLVGGGMGCAPLYFLAKSIPDGKVTLFLGARNSEELAMLKKFESLGVKVLTATEDGSMGHKGFVTDLVEKEFENVKAKAADHALYTCGPMPMMKKVAELAKENGISCQVSLEARMACGVGLCLGCAVPRAKGDGYLHVCKDGPVMEHTAIKW